MCDLKKTFLDQIPDEETALQMGGATAGQRQLPPHVVNTTQDIGDGQKMVRFVENNLSLTRKSHNMLEILESIRVSRILKND